MNTLAIHFRKLLPFFGLVFLVGCSPNENTTLEEVMNTPNDQAQDNKEVPPIIMDDARSKETLLQYFESLIENQQIIVGQQCGDAPSSTTSFYNTYVDVLADQTGRHVGMIGADFGWASGGNYPVQTLINHWNEGGLVTVSWHADNPFVDGVDVYWNTVDDKETITLKTLLSGEPQSKAWISYRNELDQVAGALQKLQAAGVTVIWRPFHEMNGDFFWWGTNAHGNQQTNEADYKALWIDLYNVLVNDYGLNNLIWAYSVVPSETWYASVTAYYPGSDYVDLVGMDYYGNEPAFPHYEELSSLGKPVVMSESGPRENGYGQWNMMTFANILKGKAAYFLQWHSWNGAAVAIKDNRNAIEMMNGEAVITRDEIMPISF